jgi:predicted MFS family arabinose efflux permease
VSSAHGTLPAVRRVSSLPLGQAAIWAAVALAFADSSIVVLALPDLLRQLDTSIEGVSSVITAYNVAVVVATPLVVLLVRRAGPRACLHGGLILFAAGSAGCALARSLELLVALRVVQALGGALLLASALPTLGVRRWSVAAAVGAALGPAVGGLLTEALDWRAIFAFQAPVALAALVTGWRAARETERPDSSHGRIDLRSNAGLALISGALVGALFLVVILVIEVWGLSPASAALLVSVLPATTVAAGPLARGAALRPSAVAGAILVAGGLAGVALLPERSVVWLALALALVGAGLGIAGERLSEAALASEAIEPAAWSVAARHLGLVVGLVLVAPMLSTGIDRGADRASEAGAGVVLDAPIAPRAKLQLGLDIARALESAPRASVPDFRPAFAAARDRDAGQAAALTATERRLGDRVRAVLERGFRPSLWVCVALALLACLPIAWPSARRTA